MTLGPALAGGIRALGLDIDAAAQAKLVAYVALLEKWNRTHNLTAIRDPERMLTHHLLDALAVLPHFPRSASLRLVDIGSGGGVPGVPIAVARPAWQVTLVDSSRKKTAFLRQAVIELSLPNVEIATTRVEDYEPPAPFDIAMSRAYSDLRAFAAAARRLAPTGEWMAMKGTYPEDELAQLPADVQVTAISKLDVPGIDAERHLVIMQASRP
jgi:16S rRNA (guanine527-N7)-methyltransferase